MAQSQDQILAGIAAATEADLMPRIVMTTTHLGVKITVIEPVIPTQDGRGRRGYRWFAVAGNVTLEPARVAGRIIFASSFHGEYLAESSRSARSVLANARAVLNARARTARLTGQ